MRISDWSSDVCSSDLPLNRHGTDYAWRGALYSSATATAPIFAPPTWPDNAVPGQYDYLCVDGGTMNNEPFELARTALAGIAGANPPQGLAANRAEIGRASGRARGGKYGEISVG